MVNETMSTAEKLAEALDRVKFEAVSLADAQVIALEALAAYRAQPAEDARPTIPASAPGAAEHLAVLMRAIATKCRVGYVISKTVNSNIRTAAEISEALNAGFSAAQPAADGAQRVDRMSEEQEHIVTVAGLKLFNLSRQWADNKIHSYQHSREAERIVAEAIRAAWGVKLDGEA